MMTTSDKRIWVFKVVTPEMLRKNLIEILAVKWVQAGWPACAVSAGIKLLHRLKGCKYREIVIDIGKRKSTCWNLFNIA